MFIAIQLEQNKVCVIKIHITRIIIHICSRMNRIRACMFQSKHSICEDDLQGKNLRKI